MKVFLVGFMGCGKSTLGRKLAAKLNYDFIDLDDRLEQITGLSVGTYFTTYGEEAFRNLESETLKKLDYLNNSVISTGGGTPCYFDNINWMNNNGLTIYIEMSPVSLAKRLEKGKAERPLLKDLQEDEIVAFIENKLAERQNFYNQASITVNGINLSADMLKNAILLKGREFHSGRQV